MFTHVCTECKKKQYSSVRKDPRPCVYCGASVSLLGMYGGVNEKTASSSNSSVCTSDSRNADSPTVYRATPWDIRK